jgi:phytoene dehydrogenase-like protein
MPKDPQMFVPLPDGRHFFVWRDAQRTREELDRIRPGEGDGHARWSSFWDAAVAELRPLVDAPNPPPFEKLRDYMPDDVWRLAVAGSAAATVEEFFTAPEVQGAFASQGIIGTWTGVRDEGTAWVMAYHAVGGEVNGADGTWAYVRGGMGSVSNAIASAARAAGAEIRLNAPVVEIMAGGVRIEGGDVIRSRAVLSNGHPSTTYALAGLSVPDDWRTPGCVLKVNLALSELPEFTALPGAGPQQQGTVEISPSVDYLQAAFDDAVAGSPSARPFMEVFIQSAVDRSLVDGDGHVLSAFTQYVPPSAEDWPVVRDRATQNVIDTLASYAPNIRNAIVACEALGPPELEQRFGLVGGNIFHGEITPEQSFGSRFSYRTPLDGLYLCGSGARPGGGVMGAAGRNAARVVIEDLRK